MLKPALTDFFLSFFFCHLGLIVNTALTYHPLDMTQNRATLPFIDTTAKGLIFTLLLAPCWSPPAPGVNAWLFSYLNVPLTSHSFCPRAICCWTGSIQWVHKSLFLVKRAVRHSQNNNVLGRKTGTMSQKKKWVIILSGFVIR